MKKRIILIAALMVLLPATSFASIKTKFNPFTGKLDYYGDDVNLDVTYLKLNQSTPQTLIGAPTLSDTADFTLGWDSILATHGHKLTLKGGTGSGVSGGDIFLSGGNGSNYGNTGSIYLNPGSSSGVAALGNINFNWDGFNSYGFTRVYGKIGIKTDPTYDTDINGTFRANGTTAASNVFGDGSAGGITLGGVTLTGDTTTVTGPQFIKAWAGATYDKIMIGSLGNYYPGIWFADNTVTPSYTNYSFLYSPGQGCILNAATGQNFLFRVGNTDYLSLTPSGGLSLGNVYAYSFKPYYDPGVNNFSIQGRFGVNNIRPSVKLEVCDNGSLGVEVVTNGSFTSDVSGWTGTNATLTNVGSGKIGNCLQVANNSAAAGYAYQTFTTVVGEHYYVQYYFNKGTSANLAVKIGSSVGGSQYYSSGDHTVPGYWLGNFPDFVATTTTTTISLWNSSTTNGQTSLFDEISIKPFTGGDVIARGYSQSTNFRTNAVETTVSGSVSGSAYYSQPHQGATYKKVVIRLAALNGTASYTFPTAFLYTPSVVTTNGLATSLVTTLNTTTAIVTGATSTGFLLLEGY